VLTNDRHFVSAREDARPTNCSHLNQSLMELGALICTPRSPQCLVCPVKKFCVAFKANRTTELPNLGKREAATARHFIAFAIQWNGKFLVQQRPSGVVNAQLWEFPNLEITGTKPDTRKLFVSIFGITPPRILPLCTVKHSITRYRITLEAFHASLGGASSMSPFSITKTRTRGTRTTKTGGVWKTPAQLPQLAFTAAHKKLASAAVKSILSGR
jgi:A/G-specific adenine glycosylase